MLNCRYFIDPLRAATARCAFHEDDSRQISSHRCVLLHLRSSFADYRFKFFVQLLEFL